MVYMSEAGIRFPIPGAQRNNNKVSCGIKSEVKNTVFYNNICIFEDPTKEKIWSKAIAILAHDQNRKLWRKRIKKYAQLEGW